MNKLKEGESIEYSAGGTNGGTTPGDEILTTPTITIGSDITEFHKDWYGNVTEDNLRIYVDLSGIDDITSCVLEFSGDTEIWEDTCIDVTFDNDYVSDIYIRSDFICGGDSYYRLIVNGVASNILHIYLDIDNPEVNPEYQCPECGGYGGAHFDGCSFMNDPI